MRGAGSLHCDRLEQLRIDGAARIDFGNVLIRRIAAPRARILLELSRDEHEAVDRRLDSPNRRLGNAVAAFPATEEIRVRIALRPNESQRRDVQPVALGTRQHAHRVRVVKPARKQKRERRRLHRGIEGRRADVVQGAEQVLEGRFGVEALHDLAETARRDPRAAEQRTEGEREKAAGERLVIRKVVRVGAEIAPGIEKRVAAVSQREAGDLTNPALVAQLDGAANLLIALEFRVRHDKRAEIRGGLPIPRSREQDVGIARRGREKRAVGHERATVAINITPDTKLVFCDEFNQVDVARGGSDARVANPTERRCRCRSAGQGHHRIGQHLRSRPEKTDPAIDAIHAVSFRHAMRHQTSFPFGERITLHSADAPLNEAQCRYERLGTRQRPDSGTKKRGSSIELPRKGKA